MKHFSELMIVNTSINNVTMLQEQTAANIGSNVYFCSSFLNVQYVLLLKWTWVWISPVHLNPRSKERVELVWVHPKGESQHSSLVSPDCQSHLWHLVSLHAQKQHQAYYTWPIWRLKLPWGKYVIYNVLNVHSILKISGNVYSVIQLPVL